ncbi:MAG: molybdenum cofactor synthesis domain-containing protein [Bacteroidota bacterium]
MIIKIESVNISEQKGTVKKPVDKITINAMGVAHDAHAGDWHRQVSMLACESVEKFSKQAGREIGFGEFAENLTVRGMNLVETAPLDIFKFNEVVLEVTQIGKKCHGDNCAIFREVGNCVMPKEGIFCRVINGGELKAGDTGQYEPKVFKIHVITLSDRAYKGVYEDRSGPAIETKAGQYFVDRKRNAEVKRTVIPDNAETLRNLLHELIPVTDFIFTTGGTGIAERDITPETVKPFLTKEIPGIMEMIRVKYGSLKSNALLSRGVAGLAGDTFIFTLPGSLKAVDEYLGEILPMLEHMVYMKAGLDTH